MRVQPVVPAGLPPVDIPVVLRGAATLSLPTRPWCQRKLEPAWLDPNAPGSLYRNTLHTGQRQPDHVALPFPVQFYGAESSSSSRCPITAMSSSALLMGATGRAPAECPGMALPPNSAIYVLAYDWNPSLGGQIIVHRPDAGTYVVTWRDVTHSGDSAAPVIPTRDERATARFSPTTGPWSHPCRASSARRTTTGRSRSQVLCNGAGRQVKSGESVQFETRPCPGSAAGVRRYNLRAVMNTRLHLHALRSAARTRTARSALGLVALSFAHCSFVALRWLHAARASRDHRPLPGRHARPGRLRRPLRPPLSARPRATRSCCAWWTPEFLSPDAPQPAGAVLAASWRHSARRRAARCRSRPCARRATARAGCSIRSAPLRPCARVPARHRRAGRGRARESGRSGPAPAPQFACSTRRSRRTCTRLRAKPAIRRAACTRCSTWPTSTMPPSCPTRWRSAGDLGRRRQPADRLPVSAGRPRRAARAATARPEDLSHAVLEPVPVGGRDAGSGPPAAARDRNRCSGC